jgi:hypothetical protein
MKHFFLVSLPRSGSTMTQAVLSNHGSIATVPEPWIQLLAQSFNRPDLVRSKFEWQLGVEALDRCSSDQDWVGLAGDRLHDLADQLYCEACEGSDATYFLDKTPRYYYILEELYARYPDAKFLILTRNLTSVLLSVYKTWIKQGSPLGLDRYLGDLFEGPRCLSDFIQKHGDSKRVHSVSYESILAEPLVAFQRIFEWLELDFDPALLNYEGNAQYQGKFGDPTGVQRGGVINQTVPTGRKFAEAFPDREWAQLAAGLADYALQEGVLNPHAEQWELGKSTAAFKRLQRRYTILYRDRGIPGAKESFMLLVDGFIRRLRYK